MPLDNDAISALSMPELRVRLNECRQARVAERVAQREAMLAGAAATDYDASSWAARIHVSETTIQELDTDIASLLAEEMAKSDARHAAEMGEVANMDSRMADIKEQRVSRDAASRASAKDVSPGRKPTNLMADLAADTPSPEDEATRRYMRCKAQLVARRAERALAPASPASTNEANDAALERYLDCSPESEQEKQTRIQENIAAKIRPRTPRPGSRGGSPARAMSPRRLAKPVADAAARSLSFARKKAGEAGQAARYASPLPRRDRAVVMPHA